MAKDKDSLFWIAPGVVTVDGKKYGIDDALPIEKIEKEKLARWKKDGKIGAKIAPVKADNSIEIAELKAKIVDLEKQLEDATAPDDSGDGEK